MRGDEAAKSKARQAARGSVGDPIDRNLAIQVDRMLQPTLKRFTLLAEKVEVLNGDRQNAPNRKAVRKSDLSSLANIGLQRSKKKPDVDGPTKEQLDAVIEDIEAIHKALRAIVTTLNGR